MSERAARYRAQVRGAARLALTASSAVAEDLAALLYERWYAPPAGAWGVAISPAALAAHLRAADSAGERFEEGWTVLPVADAATLIGAPRTPWQVPAVRGAEVRWVDPVDLVFRGGVGLRPPDGASIAVSARHDSLSLLPGWWTSMGPAWSRATQPLVRLYWSAEPGRLFAVVAGITRSLDPDLPYALKCALDTERHRRPDALVLYLARRDWPAAATAVATAHQAVGASLRTSTPALTAELAPGLALAEDPGDESFGTSRCRILADALWAARTARSTDPEALCEAGVAALRRVGIGIDAPWRSPGSTTDYTFGADAVRAI